MYGFIYITTNHVNGRQYIGQKKYDKSGKWKKYLGSGIALKNAIAKYGLESFSKEIIEECDSKELLDERERYWINYYNATKSDHFYNIAKGGDGGNVVAGYTEKEYVDFQNKRMKAVNLNRRQGEQCVASKLTENQVLEIVRRLKNNEFHSDIAKDYNVSTSTIDDIRCHKTWKHLTQNIIFDDISKRNRPRNGKPVVQYENDGKYVATYKNAREAQKETGISYKLISSVCNGSKRIAHGYIWRFVGDSFDKYEPENAYLIKVDKYDLDGNFIQTFDSIVEANNSIETGRVDRALKTKNKYAGGFYWTKHGERLQLHKVS